MFVRKDLRLIFVEIKYHEGAVHAAAVANELNQKIDLFLREKPSYRHHTIEKVLVTTGTPDENQTLIHFDRVITLDELFLAARSVAAK
jgi:hypothetical protein